MRNLFTLMMQKVLMGNARNKRRLIRSMVLISLVVALLLVSLVFVVSMVKGIEKTYVTLGGGNATVPLSTQIPSSLEFIESQDDVTLGAALIYGKNGTKVCAIKAVDTSVYFNDQRQSLMNLDTETVDTSLPLLYISLELSKTLGLDIGDSIALVSVGGQNGQRVRPHLCKVGGIFDTGYKELDERLIFTSNATMDTLFASGTESYKELTFSSASSTDEGVSELQQMGIHAEPWYQKSPDIYQNLLTSQQTLMTVFIAIALLCGFFVSSLALEMIQSDHKTIAIEKMIGLNGNRIKKVYFVSVEVATLVAIACGTVLGFLLSSLLPYFLNYIATFHFAVFDWYLLKFTVFYPVRNIIELLIALLFVSFVTVWISMRRIHAVEPLDLLKSH